MKRIKTFDEFVAEGMGENIAGLKQQDKGTLKDFVIWFCETNTDVKIDPKVSEDMITAWAEWTYEKDEFDDRNLIKSDFGASQFYHKNAAVMTTFKSKESRRSDITITYKIAGETFITQSTSNAFEK